MNTRRIHLGGSADAQAEAHQHISALLAEQAQVDCYTPPTYRYNPHIRLRATDQRER